MTQTGLYITIIAFGFFSYVLTCLALVDAALRKFSTLQQKILWVAIAFIPFAGWIIYFIFGKKRGIRPN